jgi:formyltetrahydrofolate synthetase
LNRQVTNVYFCIRYQQLYIRKKGESVEYVRYIKLPPYRYTGRHLHPCPVLYLEVLAFRTAVRKGGIALAEKVLKAMEEKENDFHVLYEDEMPLADKITKIAKEIYGASGVNFAPAAVKQLKRLTELGFGNLPVCMAKNQYSLSDDPTLLGRPSGFELNVREAYVSAGAGFVVVLTGAVMTMPGLPKAPAAYNIDVDNNGKITGLF